MNETWGLVRWYGTLKLILSNHSLEENQCVYFLYIMYIFLSSIKYVIKKHGIRIIDSYFICREWNVVVYRCNRIHTNRHIYSSRVTNPLTLSNIIWVLVRWEEWYKRTLAAGYWKNYVNRNRKLPYIYNGVFDKGSIYKVYIIK